MPILRYLLHDVLTQEQCERVHIFNTFFYQKLTKAKTKKETQAEKDALKDENGKSLIKFLFIHDFALTSKY
jgi:hypothetical protein